MKKEYTVIVIVFVIILIGILFFIMFYSTCFGCGPKIISLDSVKSQVCNIAARTGCNANPTKIYATSDGTATGEPTYKDYRSLEDICIYEYGVSNSTDCLNRVCGMSC